MMMNHNGIAIAIDGPAAAGKSTVAKKVAKELNYIYIDTGAMYRAITLKAIEHKLDLNDEQALYQLLVETDINLLHSEGTQIVTLDGRDVTEKIRNDQVTENVSVVSKHRLLREKMVADQRSLAEEANVVMDGRDIGSHVIPDAEVKVFLVASVDERARRRHKENQKKGSQVSLEQLKEEIEKRDRFDMEREISPLVKAEDAIELDTTSLSIDQVVEQILLIIEQEGVK